MMHIGGGQERNKRRDGLDDDDDLGFNPNRLISNNVMQNSSPALPGQTMFNDDLDASFFESDPKAIQSITSSSKAAKSGSTLIS